ncbi:zeta-sarcoglycan-like [Ruditapes philippinarum]|uniref:zeta-sarcoglycan-like n=1 Tax=Ruditapes philippinarum TaxID=129788 RepID=UPI00295ABDAB|nr:zeta-sarcoglycan-like [Ruditapes philippinarum]
MGKGRSSDFTESGYQPAGIYGWRKQCLYAIILFILVVVIMNLALTVWILRVLNFNIEGLNMGTIRISSEGINIAGRTDVVKTLYASNIASKKNKVLKIESERDIFLKSRYSDKINSFHIGKNKIDASCDTFEIRDPKGKSRFKVTEKGVTYGSDEVTYSGKAVFNGSIETPNIRGPHKGSLRLESASSSIILSGRDGVLIEAPEGNVEMKSAHDIIFASNKKISFNSTKIYMNNIDISAPNGSGKQYNDVYQLCVCQNGRLFLAPSVGRCVTEKETCT